MTGSAYPPPTGVSSRRSVPSRLRARLSSIRAAPSLIFAAVDFERQTLGQGLAAGRTAQRDSEPAFRALDLVQRVGRV